MLREPSVVTAFVPTNEAEFCFVDVMAFETLHEPDGFFKINGRLHRRFVFGCLMQYRRGAFLPSMTNPDGERILCIIEVWLLLDSLTDAAACSALELIIAVKPCHSAIRGLFALQRNQPDADVLIRSEISKIKLSRQGVPLLLHAQQQMEIILHTRHNGECCAVVLHDAKDGHQREQKQLLQMISITTAMRKRHSWLPVRGALQEGITK